MFSHAHRTARLLAVLPIIALFAGACSKEVRGPTNPAALDNSLSTSRSTTPSLLGAAASFTVLGGPAVTLTRSVVTGDVGAGLPLAPVTQTGGSVSGTVHMGDAAAVAAYADFLLAFDALGATPCSTDPTHALTGSLAGVTLGPGVYCFDGAAAVTGVLTLDGHGDPNAIWLIKVGAGQAGGALTGTAFSVVMAGRGLPCHVTWWSKAGVTMTSSDLKGNVLAGGGITFTGGTYVGQAMAKAAVTLTDMTAFGGCGLAPIAPCLGGVVGHGVINLAAGAKGRFEFSARARNGSFRGELAFRDRSGSGTRLVGTNVTKFVAVNDSTRHIEGDATLNGVTGFTYKLDVVDNDARGMNDAFAITVLSSAGAVVYSASGRVWTGSVEIRKCGHHRHGDDGDDGDDDGDDGDGHGRGHGDGHGDGDDGHGDGGGKSDHRH